MKGRYNEKDSYQCEYCKERFRLKMSLNNHKCKEKFNREIER